MIVALAQLNPTVGDIEANTARIVACIGRAKSARAELILFPELAIFGYPPKDLLLRRDLVDRNVAALAQVARHCTEITAVIGHVQPDPAGPASGIYNAASACQDGLVIATYAKTLLPTYDVFDETRYFRSGNAPAVVSVPTREGALRIGLTVCEDLWNDRQFHGRLVYGVDPVKRTVEAGAQMIVNIAASPFAAGKQEEREELFGGQAREHGVSIVAVNQIGGNDDLIFDGASFVMDAHGELIARAPAFEEALLLLDLPGAVLAGQPSRDPTTALRDVRPVNGLLPIVTELVCPYPDRIETIRRALVLGIRDYVAKCGFTRAVIGISGGVDSAVTAALAVSAIGAQRVCGVAMPSRFSSDHSREDARQLAANLGFRLLTIPIEDMHRAVETAVQPVFESEGLTEPGVAEENIQARIRGNLLMALSNKLGWLLLSTGNKSETAVGYCTLYGDMCGGLAVISDVPKTTVYALARRMNQAAGRPWIPQRTIEKTPSAELRPDQRDQDSLPPYDVLDPILERYVERELSIDAIVAEGFDRATVSAVARMVDQNEYKRKQAPTGLKVTSRAFGTGRRMPIAAKHR